MIDVTEIFAITSSELRGQTQMLIYATTHRRLVFVQTHVSIQPTDRPWHDKDLSGLILSN